MEVVQLPTQQKEIDEVVQLVSVRNAEQVVFYSVSQLVQVVSHRTALQVMSECIDEIIVEVDGSGADGWRQAESRQ